MEMMQRLRISGQRQGEGKLGGDILHAGSDRNATTKLPLHYVQISIDVPAGKQSFREMQGAGMLHAGTHEVLETARETRMPCGKNT
jgi:hypothetical protein